MSHTNTLPYVITFIATFLVTSVVSIAIFNFFQQPHVAEAGLYVDEDASQTSAFSEEADSRVSAQTVADMYVQHVVTVNDLTQGCGCPSCCSAS